MRKQSRSRNYWHFCWTWWRIPRTWRNTPGQHRSKRNFDKGLATIDRTGRRACNDHRSQLSSNWRSCYNLRSVGRSMGRGVCPAEERWIAPDSAVSHNAPCWGRHRPAILRGHSRSYRHVDQPQQSAKQGDAAP